MRIILISIFMSMFSNTDVAISLSPPKGYCFSASLPPLLAQACITALDKFQSSPEIFQEIRTVSQELHK